MEDDCNCCGAFVRFWETRRSLVWLSQSLCWGRGSGRGHASGVPLPVHVDEVGAHAVADVVEETKHLKTGDN